MYMINLILGDFINLIFGLIYILYMAHIETYFMIMSFKYGHIMYSTDHSNMVSFGNLIISCVLQITEWISSPMCFCIVTYIADNQSKFIIKPRNRVWSSYNIQAVVVSEYIERWNIFQTNINGKYNGYPLYTISMPVQIYLNFNLTEL